MGVVLPVLVGATWAGVGARHAQALLDAEPGAVGFSRLILGGLDVEVTPVAP